MDTHFAQIVRPKHLWPRLGVAAATGWRMVSRGDLPRPLRLSPGVVGWRQSDIDAWLQAKAEDAARG